MSFSSGRRVSHVGNYRVRFWRLVRYHGLKDLDVFYEVHYSRLKKDALKNGSPLTQVKQNDVEMDNG